MHAIEPVSMYLDDETKNLFDRVGSQCHRWVREIRGIGLMIGIELDVTPDDEKEIVASLLKSLEDADFFARSHGL